MLFGKKKPEPKPTPPPISEAKKAQAAKLMAQMNSQKGTAQTKEDKLREMMEKDPEKAAQLLRDIFLKGK